MITNKNGSKLNENEIEYFVRGYNSIFLYIKYIKGDEDSVTITFKVKNANVDNDYYTLVTGTPDKLHPFEYTIKESGNIVLECPIPEGTYYCLLSFRFNNGIQSLYGNIDITVTSNTIPF